MRHLTAVFAALLAVGGCHAAVYRYSAASGPRRAYLWVPPRCPHVRGAVVSMANLLERNWLEDPVVRQAAAEECLGAVWIGPGRGGTLNADMNGSSGEALERLMADLAKESGYQELRDGSQNEERKGKPPNSLHGPTLLRESAFDNHLTCAFREEVNSPRILLPNRLLLAILKVFQWLEK